MSELLGLGCIQALPHQQWPSMLMDIMHRSVMICHLEIRYKNKGYRHSVVLMHMWSRLFMLQHDAAVGVGIVVTL